MERFPTFIPIESHTGEALATTVLKVLNKCDIDIKNLRGQSYNNAANMSGCYNGLQAHICQIIPLAHYIPCATHSLNLVGVLLKKAALSVEEGNRCYVRFLGCHLGKKSTQLIIITERNDRTQSGRQSAEITVRFCNITEN